VNDEKKEEIVSTKIAVYVPIKIISSLKKTFSLKDNEIESFVVSLIERTVVEHASHESSDVFSADEAKEIEDNLNGLGYI
jgi:hypothetical protein